MSPGAKEQQRLAVIIPVLHDSAALLRLLADLDAQSRRPDSVIIVSGSRDEQLTTLAATRNLTLIETTAVRGLQLDTGAAAANADILWFIHADARVPDDACEAVVQAVAHGALGGCLRFALQGPRSFIKRLLEWLVRLRVAVGGMAYGDQALFCQRTAYTASGGFPHRSLFEEVSLVRHLQKAGGFSALNVPVFIATRRWERDGWLRRSVHNRWLAMRHALGTPADELAKRYRARITA